MVDKVHFPLVELKSYMTMSIDTEKNEDFGPIFQYTYSLWSILLHGKNFSYIFQINITVLV